MFELNKIMLDTKDVWVEYPGLEDFSIKVANLSRKELTALRNRCISKNYDRKTRVMMETLDEKEFVAEFTKATLLDWKGLTLKYLSSLILMDTGEHDLEQEWPFNEVNALALVTNSTEFDTWLNEVVFDLDNFRD